MLSSSRPARRRADSIHFCKSCRSGASALSDSLAIDAATNVPTPTRAATGPRARFAVGLGNRVGVNRESSDHLFHGWQLVALLGRPGLIARRTC